MLELHIQLKLSFLWIAIMLIYLLGDVLRLFSGDTVPGEIEGVKVSTHMWTLVAIMMLMPILMVLFSLALPYDINRWSNILVSLFFIALNISSLNSYSFYDKFLLVVSMALNLVIIVYAWNWAL